MKFVDIINLAEELSEEVEELGFKTINNVVMLITPKANFNKVTNWLNENQVTNVKFSIQNSIVKLTLS